MRGHEMGCAEPQVRSALRVLAGTPDGIIRAAIVRLNWQRRKVLLDALQSRGMSERGGA